MVGEIICKEVDLAYKGITKIYHLRWYNTEKVKAHPATGFKYQTVSLSMPHVGQSREPMPKRLATCMKVSKTFKVQLAEPFGTFWIFLLTHMIQYSHFTGIGTALRVVVHGLGTNFTVASRIKFRGHPRFTPEQWLIYPVSHRQIATPNSPIVIKVSRIYSRFMFTQET